MASHIMSRLGVICPCFKPIFRRRKGTYSFESPGSTRVDKENNGVITPKEKQSMREAERAVAADTQIQTVEIGLKNANVDLGENKVNGEIKEIHRQEIHLQLEGNTGEEDKDKTVEISIDRQSNSTPETAAQSHIEKLLQDQGEEWEVEGEEGEPVLRRDKRSEGAEVREDSVEVESGVVLHSSVNGDYCTDTASGRRERFYQDFAEMSDINEVYQEISEGGGEIDAYQLQNILNNCLQQDFEFGGFSDDLCRSMVAMHDGDLSGRLSGNEFAALWTDLLEWKEKYLEHDADNSGYFDKSEFSDLLEQIGLSVSEDIVHAMTVRYSDRDGHIHFNDFVACAVKLKIAITTFQDNSEDGDEAVFTTDQFIQLGMYS